MATIMEPTGDVMVHPEDAAVIEQLAKLQQMHQQIHDLRSLLPNALLGPARESIIQPRGSNPSHFAVSVMKAANDGVKGIQSFKQDWQAPETRQLFRDANAANTTQGSDTWHMDYRSLATTATRTTNTDLPREDIQVDTIEEAKIAFESFKQNERKIKLQAPDSPDMFPIDVEVNRMHFRLDRDETSNTYTIEPVTGGSLPQQIADQLTQEKSRKKLGKLLAHFEAYHAIRLRKCDKCRSLLDSDLKLPLVRKLTTERSSENPAGRWAAYHMACSP
ncbi:hypothetical protein PMZ80_003886 [Knufia obscura]|uniref:Mediator complex subunit 27 n=1 Tax=Knufia obscura TaxID=1635080 RepID=A0ABR0RWE3_9EURO|nr:hypothetical protein PMZ80_003886 [Knufia obscura]